MIFVDPISEKVEVSESGLPDGWMIPPKDVSRDIEQEPLPYGVVVACSSEASFKQALERKVLVNS